MTNVLDGVTVGDYIAWDPTDGGVCVAKVDRVIPTRVLTPGMSWRVSDGRLIGTCGLHHIWARRATDYDMKWVRIKTARHLIRSAADSLENDNALKVAEFIANLEKEDHDR